MFLFIFHPGCYVCTSSARNRSLCRKFCASFSLSLTVFFFTWVRICLACWPMLSCRKINDEWGWCILTDYWNGHYLIVSICFFVDLLRIHDFSHQFSHSLKTQCTNIASLQYSLFFYCQYVRSINTLIEHCWSIYLFKDWILFILLHFFPMLQPCLGCFCFCAHHLTFPLHSLLESSLQAIQNKHKTGDMKQ